jgi:hypothetical protein
VERFGFGSFGLGQGQVVTSCEHDNETSGSIKGGEFLCILSAFQGGLFHMELVIAIF